MLAPVVSLLLFGMIDYGMTLNDAQAVRQAVREGARQAVVGDFPDCLSVSGLGRKTACEVEVRSNLDANRLLVKVSAPNGMTTGQSVLVCAYYPATSMTGITKPFLAGKTFKSKIRMRVERKVGATTAAVTYQDVGWAGDSWCT
ncbi:MAG: pilus assembly protein [Actinobacteria bacterium]|nr:pilus assembly protein [Actinomycetota bacterium]